MSSEQENLTAQPSAAQAAEAEAPIEVHPESTPSAEAAAPAVAPDGYEPVVAADSSETSAQGMEELIDQYSVPQQAPSEGQFAEGRVVAFSDLGVVVDIGAKSEGLIPAQEFMGPEGSPQLEPGQTVEVHLPGEKKDGYVLLS